MGLFPSSCLLPSLQALLLPLAPHSHWNLPLVGEASPWGDRKAPVNLIPAESNRLQVPPHQGCGSTATSPKSHKGNLALTLYYLTRGPFSLLPSPTQLSSLITVSKRPKPG